MMNNGVGAVIVTYYPDPGHLDKLLQRMIGQVGCAVLIDNTPGISQAWHLEIRRSFGIHLLVKTHNVGIAAAQNEGIRYAQELGCEFILFLDQDSLPESGMVHQLLLAYQQLTQFGIPIGGVGPRSFMPKLNQEIPFMRLSPASQAYQSSHTFESLIPVTYLISSGTLVPVKNFEKIGLMREDLFIDYVDTEWCLRARSRGYQLFGCSHARMEHDLGDESIQLLGRTFFTHSPLRHYYLVRNAIVLYKDPTIRLGWKIRDAFKLLIKIVLYGIYCRPRWHHLKMMCYGLRDGIDNRLGEASILSNR